MIFGSQCAPLPAGEAHGQPESRRRSFACTLNDRGTNQHVSKMHTASKTASKLKSSKATHLIVKLFAQEGRQNDEKRHEHQQGYR
jgi:hypothetical protein